MKSTIEDKTLINYNSKSFQNKTYFNNYNERKRQASETSPISDDYHSNQKQIEHKL